MIPGSRFARSLRRRRLCPLWLLGVGSLLTGTLAVPTSARAQDRVLTWPTIDVTAHLDADGRLQVRERQVMRMTGDWNGGERRFTTRFGQRLHFAELVRIDSATHTEHALAAERLDSVDGYGWTDGSTLRWRSRLVSDPPFDSTTLVYELRYAYDNILEPDGDHRYRLAHDFAFSDRDSALQHFSVTLTLDSAWRAPPEFNGRYDATMLPPGQGFVVTLPLTFIGAVPPQSVRLGTSTNVRMAILTSVLGGLLLLIGRLFQQTKGRLFARMPLDAVTPQWLQEQVFSRLPEVVGAAWDDRTEAPEVAAMLARLVQEGKLASRVETKKLWVFSKHVLHLELKVQRDQFQPHEAALIRKLFVAGAMATDTDAVRARYRSSGFNPAAVIRSAMTARVADLAPDADRATERAARTQSRRITLTLVAVAVLLLVLGLRESLLDGLAALTAFAISVFWYVMARGFAVQWRDRVTHVLSFSMLVLAPIAVMGAAFVWFVLRDHWRVGPFILAAIAVWLLAVVHSIVANARSTQSAERLALRQRLAVARAWFARELRREQPQLTDAWYPYLLAFGLGSHVDKWFKAFGAAANGTAFGSTSMSNIGHANSSGSSSGGAVGRAMFGGGGGFSGGGGGVDFGAAIGSMSSSVSSPSSSSSGSSSSSSSSSSSGGGGGGGW